MAKAKKMTQKRRKELLEAFYSSFSTAMAEEDAKPFSAVIMEAYHNPHNKDDLNVLRSLEAAAELEGVDFEVPVLKSVELATKLSMDMHNENN